MGGTPTDELLSYVFNKLKLPVDSMQQLHEVLDKRHSVGTCWPQRYSA